MDFRRSWTLRAIGYRDRFSGGPETARWADHESMVDELVTVTLWRPTGPEELALVEASGWRAWPPRLPDQPIFYPVCNEEYATMIARDWNVSASGVGYVTRFRVRRDFLNRYDVHQVGGQIAAEKNHSAGRVKPPHQRPDPVWLDGPDQMVQALDVLVERGPHLGGNGGLSRRASLHGVERGGMGDG